MSIIRDNVNSGPHGLRTLLKKGFVVSVGVFNSITAIQAQKAGFTCAYLSGSGVAATMGMPDLSFTTLTEVADEARKITNVTSIPLIVDADTGFGEPLNLSRTVRVMEQSSAAGIHIEDQVLPKKCGHLSGKRVIDEKEMILKIKAAVTARQNDDFVIIARTDSRSVLGLDDAIRRGNMYLENGADMVFPEALESREEFERYAKEVKGMLIANMTEFGRSPLLSADELDGLGYKAVIFPLTAFRASLRATQDLYAKLLSSGTQKDMVESIMSRREFYDLIGYSDYEKEDSEIFGDANE